MNILDHNAAASEFGFLKAGEQPPDFDPYPLFHKLRSRHPVWHSDWGDWYVSDYDGVNAVLLNKNCTQFPPDERELVSRLNPNPAGVVPSFSNWLLFLDPPRHTIMRRMLMRLARGVSLNRLKALIDSVCDQLITEQCVDGSCEFVSRVAKILPVSVICKILAIPECDRHLITLWTNSLKRGFDVGLNHLSHEEMALLDDMHAYFLSIIENRSWRQSIAHSELGAYVETFPKDEVAANLAMLAFAGHETTIHLISNVFFILSQNPEIWQQLKVSPDLTANVVNEALRYQSPVQKICRMNRCPIELEGKQIPEGEMLVLLLGAANRDPRHFRDPDKFDPFRMDNKHIAFGVGAHRCLGDSLALLEANTMLSTVLRHWRTIDADPASAHWIPNSSLRGLDRFDIKWTV